ncbi:MAG: hypothetical protein JOZ96_01345 [Acidobacteria bacterium]|nr:hypothetical protein [Acidobacteriota bacterium]MBV9923656.1 hypothetical protein [Acidobacteriota bacterium]
MTRTFVALIALLLVLVPAVAAQDKTKKKGLPKGTPVLWRARDVARLDLAAGPGGAAMRPALRRLTFVKEEKGGWSKKYRVRDARGREWVAKVGEEAQPETAASRLIWAAGYETEITYLVPRVNIPGKGWLTNVRFEARPDNVKRHGEWSWARNPFSGTRELDGLKVLMVLINNWDLKDVNNVILHTKGSGELRYAISDLGATFGKTGGLGPLWRITRSRNKPEDYADSKFIDKVKDGYVDFHFTGVNKGEVEKIKVEHARWIGQRLSALTDGQLAALFRAANYTPAETRLLARAVRGRIEELSSLPQ